MISMDDYPIVTLSREKWKKTLEIFKKYRLACTES